MSPRSLFGREHDLRVVRTFVDDATASGGALMLWGQAGVGKSALLDAAAAHATGARLSRITGAEFDAEVSFSALGRILHPFLDGITQLRPAHAAALTAALDLGAGSSPDQLVISHAALALLADAGPVLLIVDDLPWLDRASAQVLRFVARRQAGTRICVLAAARSAEPSGLHEYEVKPLGNADAEMLLRHHFPAMPARVRARLLAEAQGNPLALIELPATLTEWQRSTAGALPAVLPLNQRLHNAFLTRISGLPADTRDLLLFVALDGTGELRTLEAIGPGCAGLAPAERLGLVQVDDSGGRVSFSHPLVRAAVVQGSTETERRGVHRRLAKAHTAHAGRHAWHLAEAATGPDEHVAVLLQASAHVNLRRGDPVHAISELLRAAELSPGADGRSVRLAEAAYLGSVITGDLTNAPHLLQTARRIAPGSSLPVALATANHLLSQGGNIEEAHDLLVTAIHAAPDPADRTDKTLIEALFNLLLVCGFGGGRLDLWEPLHAAIGRLAPEPPELLAILDVTFADPARATQPMLDRLDAVIARLPSEVSPARIVRAATAAGYVDRLPACREALMRVVGYGREGGPVTSAIEALFLLGTDSFLSGQWDQAAALADEGLDLCERHGYQLLACRGRLLRAMLAAVRGDDANTVVREVHNWAGTRHAGLLRHFAAHVSMLTELGRGDFKAAYGFAASITPVGTIASHVPQALWTIADTVEAALRSGRHDEAAAHVAAVHAGKIGAISPRLAFLAGLAEAVVSPADLFTELLATPGLDRWPFDLARAELSCGERLRRLKMTDEARAHLTVALEAFQRLGARPWVTRASNELRAAGQAADRLGVPDAVVLTPQQRQIAVLAAEGLTNKQIGERLFLSPRTVAAHLYQLFPKLGITSRAALRDALTKLNDKS